MPPRPTTALPRGARRCLLPWLSPGGPADPPVLQHWVPHRLPGVLETPGWRGGFSVLLPAPSSSQGTCWGGRSSELSHPGEHWVPSLEPRSEREKRTSWREGLGRVGTSALAPPVGAGTRGGPAGCPGAGATRGRSCGAAGACGAVLGGVN